MPYPDPKDFVLGPAFIPVHYWFSGCLCTETCSVIQKTQKMDLMYVCTFELRFRLVWRYKIYLAVCQFLKLEARTFSSVCFTFAITHVVTSRTIDNQRIVLGLDTGMSADKGAT